MSGGPTLRLIADDLTGAFDSAAPFARPDAPVVVTLGAPVDPAPPRLALSTESRDLSEAAAVAAVERAAGLLARGTGPGTLWFKKVDSVLRGHPFAETAALFRAVGSSACVFAPAFPAMGRMTFGGVHGVDDGTGWRALPNGRLAAGLMAAGFGGGAMPAAVVPEGGTDSALAAGIAPWRGRPGVLWAGARGLADALGQERPGGRGSLPVPPLAGVIVGTMHPATRAQVAALKAARTGLPLLDPAPDMPDAPATRAAIARHLAQTPADKLHGPLPDAAFVIVGGDTLATVLEAVGALGAQVLGEVAPGLPLARIEGGRLAGRLIVTKSGGFGGPATLMRLARGSAP